MFDTIGLRGKSSISPFIYKSIKNKYEQENNNRLFSFDVLFTRDHKKINSIVFRKDTHGYLYLDWESISPISWKQGTLKSLISRAYMICCNQSLLEKELKHLKHDFDKKIGYRLWLINQVIETVKESINTEFISANQLDIAEANNEKLHPLTLPYVCPKR